MKYAYAYAYSSNSDNSYHVTNSSTLRGAKMAASRYYDGNCYILTVEQFKDGGEGPDATVAVKRDGKWAESY